MIFYSQLAYYLCFSVFVFDVDGSFISKDYYKEMDDDWVIEEIMIMSIPQVVAGCHLSSWANLTCPPKTNYPPSFAVLRYPSLLLCRTSNVQYLALFFIWQQGTKWILCETDPLSMYTGEGIA